MFERFTYRVRRVIPLANQQAIRLNHGSVANEHVLIGLLDSDCTAACMLRDLGVDLAALRQEVAGSMSLGSTCHPDIGRLPQTSGVRHTIERAILAVRELNHDCVGTEHLLLALCCEPDGMVGQALRKRGIIQEDIRGRLSEVLETQARQAQSLGRFREHLGDAISALAGAREEAAALNNPKLVHEVKVLTALVHHLSRWL